MEVNIQHMTTGTVLGIHIIEVIAYMGYSHQTPVLRYCSMACKIDHGGLVLEVWPLARLGLPGPRIESLWQQIYIYIPPFTHSPSVFPLSDGE